MGFNTGHTHDYATLRAFRHALRAQEVSRKAVRPRRRLFQR